ncbi:MAG: hypothetical protein P1V97_00445 [Planctomycetota bacterium]|nr:hypothetical protein [Planctomycetota bacterium]
MNRLKLLLLFFAATLSGCQSLPTWTRVIVGPKEVKGPDAIEAVAVDSKDPDTLYLAMRLCTEAKNFSFRIRPLLWRSDDCGKTWVDIGKGLKNKFIRRLHMTSVEGLEAPILLAAAERSLFISMDRGASWKDLSAGLDSRENIVAMAVHPKNAKELIVIFEGGRCVQSVDGGKTWRKAAALDVGPSSYCVDSGACVYLQSAKGVFARRFEEKKWRKLSPAGRPFSNSDIAVVSGTPSWLYVTSDEGVLASQDGGKNWTVLPDTKGVKGIEVDPDDKSRIYVQTRESQIITSNDLGQSWRELSENMAFWALNLAGKNKTLLASDRVSRVIFRCQIPALD